MKKKIAGRLILLGIAVLIGYCVAEVAYFRVLITVTPLGKRRALHEGVRALAQTSKVGVIPRDYVAILGDSYAQGFGNWFLSVDWNKNPEFHSTHILHKRTGRDVVSFGGGGQGSLGGIVVEPITQLRFIEASYLYRIEPPTRFVIYFYEGNDFHNNLTDLEVRFVKQGGYALSHVGELAVFDDFIENVVLKQDKLYQAADSWRPKDSFMLAEFVGCLLRGKGTKVSDAELRRRQAEEVVQTGAGSQNRIMLAGKEYHIPDSLQSPPVELSPAELTLATYVFERSLAYLRQAFPDSRVDVVYLPSPLSCYELLSDECTIQDYRERGNLFTREQIQARSDEACRLIATATEAQDCLFVDARPFLRRAATTDLVHGPKDWKHFNRRGYEALVNAAMSLFDSAESE